MTFHILHQVWLPPPKVKIEGKDRDREREGRTLLLFCYYFQGSCATSLVSLKMSSCLFLSFSVSCFPPSLRLFSNPLIQAAESIEEFLLDILLTY